MRHFYDMGTCLSLQITFFGRTFGIAIHFYRRTFCVCLHFYGRTFDPQSNKHEENTKKRRRKHERYTQFRAFFVQTEDKSSGENSPLIYEKISGLNWTTEKQRVKMTR